MSTKSAPSCRKRIELLQLLERHYKGGHVYEEEKISIINGSRIDIY